MSALASLMTAAAGMARGVFAPRAVAAPASPSTLPDRISDPVWSTSRPLKVFPKGFRAGAAGTAIYAGRIRYEEFNTDLENQKGFGRYSAQGVFDLMRKTDPQIARMLRLVKLPIRSARWIMEPGGDSREYKEHADFVSYCLFERLAWDPLLAQQLTYLDFGFSLHEALEVNDEVPRARFPGLKTHETGISVPPRPGRPGKAATTTAVVYSSLEMRPAKTIYRWRVKQDAPLEVEAVQQLLPSDDNNKEVWRIIPGDRLVRLTRDQEGQNFQGVSLLRTAYKPWVIKDDLERWEAIAHERRHVGVPVIKLPAGADDSAVNKADEILSHLMSHEQGYVTLPFGWELEWLTTDSTEGTDVGQTIERLKRDIADNILAGFMNLGNTSGPGSYALADTQADQYLLNIEAESRYIEDSWNHGHDGWSPIRRLVDLNYGPQEKYPRLKATNLRSRDYGQILPLVAELVRFGAITPTVDLENFIRTRLDLPGNIIQAESELDETASTQTDESSDPTQRDLANPNAPLAPRPDETAPREKETTGTAGRPAGAEPRSAPAPSPREGG